MLISLLLSSKLTDVLVRAGPWQQGALHATIDKCQRIVVGFASETKLTEPVLVEPRVVTAKARLGRDVLGLSAEFAGPGIAAREEGRNETQSVVCDTGHGFVVARVRTSLLLL